MADEVRKVGAFVVIATLIAAIGIIGYQILARGCTVKTVGELIRAELDCPRQEQATVQDAKAAVPGNSPPFPKAETCYKFEGTFKSSVGQIVEFEPQAGCAFKARIKSPLNFHIYSSEANGTAGVDSAAYQVVQTDTDNCTVHLRGWIFDIKKRSYRIYAEVESNPDHCKPFDSDWSDHQILYKN